MNRDRPLEYAEELIRARRFAASEDELVAAVVGLVRRPTSDRRLDPVRHYDALEECLFALFDYSSPATIGPDISLELCEQIRSDWGVDGAGVHGTMLTILGQLGPPAELRPWLVCEAEASSDSEVKSQLVELASRHGTPIR